MNEENISKTELWRWKLIRKVADFVNQPDDYNISELKAMIESYQNYHNILQYKSENNTCL